MGEKDELGSDEYNCGDITMNPIFRVAIPGSPTLTTYRTFIVSHILPGPNMVGTATDLYNMTLSDATMLTFDKDTPGSVTNYPPYSTTGLDDDTTLFEFSHSDVFEIVISSSTYDTASCSINQPSTEPEYSNLWFLTLRNARVDATDYTGNVGGGQNFDDVEKERDVDKVILAHLGYNMFTWAPEIVEGETKRVLRGWKESDARNGTIKVKNPDSTDGDPYDIIIPIREWCPLQGLVYPD